MPTYLRLRDMLPERVRLGQEQVNVFLSFVIITCT